jgi:hypothetical protein
MKLEIRNLSHAMNSAMLNAIESASESGFVICFHLCFVVFSLLGTNKIQVGGCNKS